MKGRLAELRRNLLIASDFGLSRSLDGGRKALRIVGADAADLARFKPKLDGVQTGHIVEPKTWRHSDAKSVPPVVTHDRNPVDFVERQRIAPQSRTEVPAQFVAGDFDGERLENDGERDGDDRYENQRRPSRSPDDGSSNQADGETGREDQSSWLRVMIRNGRGL